MEGLHLEAIAPVLEDADLTPLCLHGWETWQAARGSLSVSEFVDDGTPRGAGWHMSGELLAHATGDEATGTPAG